jgi:protein farnesyltransferase subunit beta
MTYSRPWILYWILHALNLLQQEPYHAYSRIIESLRRMQSPTGGYGGGPGQLPHCATTYSGVLALCTIGTEEAYQSINRQALYHFFLSMKDPSSGGFRMHHDGEVDSRGTYTVLAIARLVNILTPELIEGTAEYLLQCQSYEGGFGGEPGSEAHGGYNFCALAALLILKQTHRCNIQAQLHWLVHRQLKLEGGFQGRTNKLVDACYSYWQGAAMAIMEIINQNGDDLSDMRRYHHLLSLQHQQVFKNDDDEEELSEDEEEVHIRVIEDEDGALLFNQRKLQQYILHCGQNLDGGLRGKSLVLALTIEPLLNP